MSRESQAAGAPSEAITRMLEQIQVIQVYLKENVWGKKEEKKG